MVRIFGEIVNDDKIFILTGIQKILNVGSGSGQKGLESRTIFNHIYICTVIHTSTLKLYIRYTLFLTIDVNVCTVIHTGTSTLNLLLFL